MKVLVILLLVPWAILIAVSISYPNEHTRMKAFIRNESIQCEKLSFLKFRFLFRQYEKRDNFLELYCSYPGEPSFEYKNDDCIVLLQTYKIMLGDQRFVYFGIINHLVYLLWLIVYTESMKDKKDFKSKFVKGLFGRGNDKSR